MRKKKRRLNGEKNEIEAIRRTISQFQSPLSHAEYIPCVLAAYEYIRLYLRAPSRRKIRFIRGTPGVRDRAPHQNSFMALERGEGRPQMGIAVI